MVIDERGKIFGKVSIIDILIVVLILGAAGVIWNQFGNKIESPTLTSKPKDKLEVTFYVESINDFVVDAIKVGDVARDPSKGVEFGVVKEVKKDEAILFGTNSKGEIVKSSKPGYSSAQVVVEGQGNIADTGIRFGAEEYVVGKSFELRLGNASGIWTRISEIKKVEE